MGSLVLGECVGCRETVEQAIVEHRIVRHDDGDLPASLFLGFAEKHRLGDGETECLAFAAVNPFDICCDDRRARAAVKAEFGEARLTGSLGLLREAIGASLLDQTRAFAAYELMRNLGGFLPAVTKEFFTAF